jgi:RTX calcium-binding nonapeptide repeat (4 copies)
MTSPTRALSPAARDSHIRLRASPIPVVLTLALSLSIAAWVAVANANVSHAGWPSRSGKLFAAPSVYPSSSPRHGSDNGASLMGTAQNDELLGGHGNDRIYGGPGNDVLWGDAIPGDVKSQHDYLDGGPGSDILYTGHGWNDVYGGPGRDLIHAEFGSGHIDCGSGLDTVLVTRLTRPNYTYKHCEKIVTVGGR